MKHIRYADAPPGLYVHPTKYKLAQLMVKQPKTIDNAMEWGAVLGMDVYVDEMLCNENDWYIIERPRSSVVVKLME